MCALRQASFLALLVVVIALAMSVLEPLLIWTLSTQPNLILYEPNLPRSSQIMLSLTCSRSTSCRTEAFLALHDRATIRSWSTKTRWARTSFSNLQTTWLTFIHALHALYQSYLPLTSLTMLLPGPELTLAEISTMTNLSSSLNFRAEEKLLSATRNYRLLENGSGISTSTWKIPCISW